MLDSFCIVFFKTLATIIPLLGNPLLGNHQSTTGQLGNHHPTTGNSSLRLQPPIPVARAPYLTAIAVFCLSMFFVFPFSSTCLSLPLYELVIIQHYNHHCVGLQKHKNHAPPITELYKIHLVNIYWCTHRSGRHFRTKLMSRYIGAGIKDRFDVRIQERYKKKKTKKDPKKHFFSKKHQDF